MRDHDYGRCISACEEKYRMGLDAEWCAVCQIRRLSARCDELEQASEEGSAVYMNRIREEIERAEFQARRADALSARCAALELALTQVLALFPSAETLDDCDDDDMSGRRPAPIMVSPRTADIRRWRQALSTPSEEPQR